MKTAIVGFGIIAAFVGALLVMASNGSRGADDWREETMTLAERVSFNRGVCFAAAAAGITGNVTIGDRHFDCRIKHS